MGREIERKFLVADESWRTPGVLATGRFLVQGYFTKDEGRRVALDLRSANTVTVDMFKGFTWQQVSAPLGSIIGRQRLINEVAELNAAAAEGAGFEVRVRLQAGRCLLGFKHGADSDRLEVEIDVHASGIPQLLAGVEGQLIQKVRYRSPLADGLMAEIDEYVGPLSGLKTVEVETSDVDTIYAKPSYFGREVTGVSQYKNATLALGEPGSFRL
jgi:CYTH domain-containing protein